MAKFEVRMFRAAHILSECSVKVEAESEDAAKAAALAMDADEDQTIDWQFYEELSGQDAKVQSVKPVDGDR